MTELVPLDAGEVERDDELLAVAADCHSLSLFLPSARYNSVTSSLSRWSEMASRLS